ncbi:unnamed protein product [Rhizophagus irregularis]|uniref:Cation/H+ exchanger transmembrane domain-containing protein n=1 Tax=Rhizophagus irregularis TaxID=588596 RepID=A0A2N1NEI1_9GLOM|nr:hypothetical protein RhiirC2_743177 [Rhizophagus irregularis]CAB4399926.1 unnamed protein product [Rhizophagus irregularis]CAB5392907.1 unnamed protein product [Rhizophagus irregularis]
MSEGGVLSGVIPTEYSPSNPLTLFIIQVVIIIAFTRLLNIVLSPLKQPRVISEVIGGIILGPSVFGRIPGYMNTIFPDASKPQLNLAANVGLVLFLFIVGVEMNPKAILKNAKAAISISAGGISLCFALGSAVSYGLYNNFTDKTEKFPIFLIFIGVAMSITAFPVLARILSELQVIRSPVGVAALTASVNDDVTSWILLALVVSLVNSSNNLTALYVFLLCIGWVFIVVMIIRPILIKLIIKTGSNENGPTLSMTVITLSTVLISAFVTSIIGVHAILGGFMIGVIIPHEGGFAVGITEKIEDLINVLFLPVYFALSGLKTQLGLLNDGKIWLWVFVVILCAMMGKIIGCGSMARLNKYTIRESLTIGVFMSCKGLVELIILNIGYDSKVINDKIFVVMVVMALVTTVTTSPLATWIYSNEYQKKLEISRNEKLGLGSQSSVNKLLHKTNYSKLLVVLNKVEWLPAMMSLVQLLQPLPKSTVVINKSDLHEEELSLAPVNSSTVVEHGGNEPLVVHALRIVELKQRISDVMKFNESEEMTLRDPIMNVFRMFGQLNFVNIKANLTVAPFQNFARQVADSVKDTESEIVIIPWNGAGSIVDDPINPLGVPKEQKLTSSQVASFVQGVFSEVNVCIGFLIDRGLGVGTRKLQTPLPNGLDIHVYFPFFGGIDDREALSFVVRLLNHPNVTATVIRIKKTNESTDNDATLSRADPLVTHFNPQNDIEPQRPPLAHEMSTTSDHVLNSGVEQELSREADELLLSEYFKVNTGKLIDNPRIKFREISSSTPLQTAVKRGEEIVKQKDLIVVGRGRQKAVVSHREEFAEVLKNFGLSYGNDTRKCLGDLAEAFLVSQIASSLCVIQGIKR